MSLRLPARLVALLAGAAVVIAVLALPHPRVSPDRRPELGGAGDRRASGVHVAALAVVAGVDAGGTTRAAERVPHAPLGVLAVLAALAGLPRPPGAGAAAHRPGPPCRTRQVRCRSGRAPPRWRAVVIAVR